MILSLAKVVKLMRNVTVASGGLDLKWTFGNMEEGCLEDMNCMNMCSEGLAAVIESRGHLQAGNS